VPAARSSAKSRPRPLGELVGAEAVALAGTSIRAGKRSPLSFWCPGVLVEIGRREIRSFDPLRMLKVSQNQPSVLQYS